jgi:hypothetical protein
MTSQERAFQGFADFAAKLKGDEKSEAQLFLIQLLDAFGHDGKSLPTGSTFEYRVRFPGDRTKYADFVWPGRVLIEMKSRGEKLSQHYQQTFDYWLNLVPHRPPYVVLCNFDEFWIYDFNTQLQDPVDRLKISELPSRHSALNFLFLHKIGAPIFGNNWVEVTREAAQSVADAFKSMIARGEDRARARRFILQSVVAMFSEDIGLLPESLFTSLLDECRRGANPYDLIGGLFRQMNESQPARGGRYVGVDYFNGGLFAKVDPIELQPPEVGLLLDAAKEDWSRVQPVIFGTIFEGSLHAKDRHAYGAHFTYEADIQKIVRPTIVRPWEERIDAAKNVPEMLELLRRLRAFRVLDPACGSGNFLFVAYRALRELEQRLQLRLFAQDKRQFAKVGITSGITPRQFFGLDLNENAVETAKVTLMLARRLAHRVAEKFWADHDDVLPGDIREQALKLEKDLPLDNLDQNIRFQDALFNPWPECDAIIGNPPYQSKNKMQKEFGPAYVKKLRKAYPVIPGRADFCVYWFHRAHDHLKRDQRAGLVGTNTIRQNYSRIGGLDYIVQNGGTICEAVSSQVWSGEAVVNVSIVNWAKGNVPGNKLLFEQLGDNRNSPWRQWKLPQINSALSPKLDVSCAKTLNANSKSPLCKQGQTPGNKGFLLDNSVATRMLRADERFREVLWPYLIGKTDLLGLPEPQPSRWVIDFHPRDKLTAAGYKELYEIVEDNVLKSRMTGAQEEQKRNEELEADTPDEAGNKHHEQFLEHWWLLSWPRPELIRLISQLPRYIVCVRVTKRPIFEFVSSKIRPSDALTVFPTADDYSFGVVQSGIHWTWFNARCSSLKRDPRYTSDTVFDTFAWPQTPTLKQIRAVADAACALRALRRETMAKNGWSLRELYKTLETPGANKLRDAQDALDVTVRAAYGMKPGEDILAFLLKLNLELAGKESAGKSITPPGLPATAANPKDFITADCVTSP